MNRIVIIGNGFDLAHGLKSSYGNFICHYMRKKIIEYKKSFDRGNYYKTSDPLFVTNKPYSMSEEVEKELSLMLYVDYDGKSLLDQLFRLRDASKQPVFKRFATPFFYKLCVQYQTKGWVDVEAEYYEVIKYLALLKKDRAAMRLPLYEDFGEVKIEDVNSQMDFLSEELIKYLKDIQSEAKIIPALKQMMYAPIHIREIAETSQNRFLDYCQVLVQERRVRKAKQLSEHGDSERALKRLEAAINEFNSNSKYEFTPHDFDACLPENVMLVNFNYTAVADEYVNDDKYMPLDRSAVSLINIHGTVNDSRVIFGYGDELDTDFQNIENLGDNIFLRNIKSINYLESDNYRRLLRMLEADAFQVYIMGHSCGTSDRTLLNTIFEHPNCVSIKVLYHKQSEVKDDFIDKIQNISRNFNDKKRMRDVVVNKMYCSPMPQANGK